MISPNLFLLTISSAPDLGAAMPRRWPSSCAWPGESSSGGGARSAEAVIETSWVMTSATESPQQQRRKDDELGFSGGASRVREPLGMLG